MSQGMKQFNTHLKLIKKQYKSRQDIEQDWRDAWKTEADLELSRKPERVVRCYKEIEMAGNELFSDEDDCSIDEEAVQREGAAATVARATHVTPA